MLLRGLVDLLRRMRNHSTPVLVYPRRPAPELAEAHAVLTRELHAQSYRVLPEDEMDPARHAPRCELAVLLLGAKYDEATRPLANALRDLEKPFVVWPSPILENAGELEQRGFLKYLDGLESGRKTPRNSSASLTPRSWNRSSSRFEERKENRHEFRGSSGAAQQAGESVSGAASL